jgi:hypothetical protein
MYKKKSLEKFITGLALIQVTIQNDIVILLFVLLQGLFDFSVTNRKEGGFS